MQINECNYPENKANFGSFKTYDDPVHKHKDGTWWFYDETWADEHGPFYTEAFCRKELKRYCKEVLGE